MTIHSGAYLPPPAATHAPGRRWSNTLASAAGDWQDIVYRAEQGRVRHNGDSRGFDGGLHEGDVVPPVPRDSLSGQRSHLRRLIDPDDHTGVAHPVLQTFEAQRPVPQPT